MIKFYLLKPIDLARQEELERLCRLFYANTPQENNVAYLSRAEKIKLVQGTNSGIASLCDGNEILAQTAFKKCRLAENINVRFIPLGNVDNNICTMLRNALVHPAYLSKGLMGTLMENLLEHLDNEDLPLALTTKSSNRPAIRIAQQFGFEETCSLVRRSDNAPMLLLVRPPVTLGKTPLTAHTPV